MKALVIPPHGDPTLTVEGAEGWEVLDVGRRFLSGVAGPARLKALAEVPAGAPRERLRAALLARAAAQLWGRGATLQLHRFLRALGAALDAVSAPPSTVHMRVDDLELVEGTTERGADVQVAALGPLPFAPELDAALQELEGWTQVDIWVERDQQLPAAAYLLQRLDPVKASLCGPFAQRHRVALAARFGVRVDTAPAGAALTLATPPGCSEKVETLAWRSDADSGPPPLGRWAGYLAVAELARRPVEVAAGVVPFCAITGDRLLGADGAWVAWEDARDAVDRLADSGVHLGGEWWVGAPGVTEAVVEETAARAAALFPRLVGVRRFHWAAQRPRAAFGGLTVDFGEAPGDRDLARSRPFELDGTIPEARLMQLIETLASHPSRAGAGRVAAALISMEPKMPAGSRLALHPDCALVSLPVSLSGEGGTSWYAVHLATGSLTAMDARLALLLAPTKDSGDYAPSLAGLPTPARERLVRMLCEKRILVERE